MPIIRLKENNVKNQISWDLKKNKPFLSTDQIPWDLERTNKITWDLKRTKTNKKENCFVFVLFSVILLKYCNRFSTPMGFKKNQTISFVRSWFMHIIRLKEKDMNSYHYFKSNPLGFRNNQLNNQNKQVEKLFWVHIIFCHSIEILE